MATELHATDSRATQALLAVVLGAVIVVVVLATVIGSSNRPARAAASYISAHSADFGLVTPAIREVDADLSQLDHGVSHQLAERLTAALVPAQANVIDASDDLYKNVDLSGTAVSAETYTAQGASDLEGALTAFAVWLADPRPTRFADVTVQITTARNEWNQGVSELWRLAGRAGPPTA